LKLFLALAARSFRRALTYRAAALAGLLTNVFFGLVRAAILISLYQGREAIAGFTAQGAITYTALTQAILAFLSMFGWWDLMNSVYRGDVASDFLKPIDYQSFWMAQDLGRALANLALRGLSIMLFFALLFDLAHPTSAIQWLALLAAILLGWLVSFAFRFLVNLAAFWTPDARGVGRLWFNAALFFSGFLMPLRFLPAWVQTVASLTPFPHMVNTVVEVYVGALRGAALARALLVQLLWAALLLSLGRIVLSRGLRRLVILGG
jgi:ABC-2 type transport system permease protein